MASIQKRPDGRWRVRYCDPDGRWRARHFAKKGDAELFRIEVSAAVLYDSYVDPKAGRRLFGDYAASWLAMQVHRPRTREHVESLMRVHIRPFFGARRIDSIRPSEVQAWIRHRSDVLAPSTLEHVLRYLAAVFNAAVRDRIIREAPTVGAKLPTQVDVEVVPPTTEEVLALAAAAPPRYRALILFAAGTGARQGESFGLALPAVDFLRRSVRIDQQLVLLVGQPPHLGPPKTPSSVRTVPLGDTTLEHLAAHLAAYPPVDLSGYGRLLFTNPEGRPLRRDAFRHVWRRTVRDSGVNPATTFRGLRHFYASCLIHAGASVKVVQKRLGHKTAKETLDTYGHLWPDSDVVTRRAVDDTFHQSLESPSDVQQQPEEFGHDR